MLKPFYESHSHIESNFPVIFHYDTLSAHSHFLSHWHENIEIIYCTVGEMVVHLDLESYSVKKGDIVVVNSGVVHTFIADHCNCEYYCLIIDKSLPDMFGINVMETKFNAVTKNAKALDIYNEIVQEINEGKEKYKIAVVSLCLKLLTEFCRNEIKEHTKGKFSDLKVISMVKNAIDYIKSNFDKKITITDICTHVGYSKYYFCRTFREFTGKTVVQYINLVRCLNAKKLLSSGTCNVEESAFLSGFNHFSYFSKCYKLYMGKSPSEELKESK